MRKKELIEEVIKLQDKYCNLVWYARSSPQNDHIEGVLENRKRIEESYPKEINQLIHSETNWEHGFNSGMLAGMRYILELSEGDFETAKEEFPFLDT
tara:strand:+ start:54 stop:344 length:291 start_codon:yes stop_codon:yes gene_type:complete